MKNTNYKINVNYMRDFKSGKFEIVTGNIKVISRLNGDYDCYDNDEMIMRVVDNKQKCIVYGGEFQECQISYDSLEYTLENIYQIRHKVESYKQAKSIIEIVATSMRKNINNIQKEVIDHDMWDMFPPLK